MTTSGLTTAFFSKVFHGIAVQLAQVRADLRQYLNGCLVSDDTVQNAVLIVSELATNAILHSDSRDAFFIVRAETFPAYIWLEVEDLGGPWHPRGPDDRPHGLDVVTALVGENWGVDTMDGGRVVWARVGFGAA